MKRAEAVGLVLAGIAFGVACGSSRDGFEQGLPNGPGAKDPTGELGKDGPGDAATPVAIGTLAGKVVMPEGTIPISDALVYLSDAAPAPIPKQAYCDKC